MCSGPEARRDAGRGEEPDLGGRGREWSLRTGPGLEGGWAPWAEEVGVVGCPFRWGWPGRRMVAGPGRLSGYEDSDAEPVPSWVVAVASFEGVYTAVAGAWGESSPSRRSAGGWWRRVPWAPWLPPP